MKLFDGRLKSYQEGHVAVLDMDVGSRDLQQCADAVIRLRAEYLFANGKRDDICFRFTSGDRAEYKKWREGERPWIVGNRVDWVRSRPADWSYENFREYLETVFRYAGTASLSRELRAVVQTADVEVGDVFIKGGFPVHAAIVMEVAIESRTGKKVFLLGQSYMPAQEIHILKNPGSQGSSPWFPADFGNRLVTPEWTFSSTELKRLQ